MTDSTFAKAGAEFVQFARSYKHTAWRLEVRDNYDDPDEADDIRKFIAGEPLDESWMDDWTGLILRRTLGGQRIGRVRVVSEPWSDYTRFGLNLSRLNVAAGEDIRYLPRDLAKELELPEYDFWLLDSSKMCILRHDEHDGLLGADIINDPKVVVEHAYFRDVAQRYATPRAEYILKNNDQ